MTTHSLYEKTLASHRAGEVSNRIGAVGGRLTVTNRRIVFEPSSVERLLGTAGWETSHAGVGAITVEPPDWRNWRSLINAGLSRTVSLTDDTGLVHRFVAHHAEQVAADLRGVANGLVEAA